MYPLVISGATVLTDRAARRLDVALDDGRIAALGRHLAGHEVIQADGLRLAPGLIDLHLNGAMGVDFTSRRLDTLPEFERHLLATGVTGYLAALNTDALDGRLAAIAAARVVVAREDPARPACLGFYFEGPYYSEAQRGAHDAALMSDPAVDEAARVLEAVGEGAAVVWSFAPERDPAGRFARWLTDHGVIPALGHSSATFEQIGAAVDAGARLMTHVYSCLTSFTGAGPTKQLGGNEGALFRDELVLEMLSDDMHLSRSLVAWIAKVAGLRRICVTTDAMAAAGLGDGVYEFLGQQVHVIEGRAYREDRTHFAGSAATLPQCLRNLAAATGAPPAEVVATATEVPARLLGLNDRGRIAVGCRADLVLLDRRWNPVATWRDGRRVWPG